MTACACVELLDGAQSVPTFIVRNRGVLNPLVFVHGGLGGEGQSAMPAPQSGDCGEAGSGGGEDKGWGRGELRGDAQCLPSVLVLCSRDPDCMRMDDMDA